MKMKRNGCSCPCYAEIDELKVGEELSDGAKITKIKHLKNGKFRVEAEQWIDYGNSYKEDELLKNTYQTL